MRCPELKYIMLLPGDSFGENVSLICTMVLCDVLVLNFPMGLRDVLLLMWGMAVPGLKSMIIGEGSPATLETSDDCVLVEMTFQVS